MGKTRISCILDIAAKKMRKELHLVCGCNAGGLCDCDKGYERQIRTLLVELLGRYETHVAKPRLAAYEKAKAKPESEAGDE